MLAPLCAPPEHPSPPPFPTLETIGKSRSIFLTSILILLLYFSHFSLLHLIQSYTAVTCLFVVQVWRNGQPNLVCFNSHKKSWFISPKVDPYNWCVELIIYFLDRFRFPCCILGFWSWFLSMNLVVSRYDSKDEVFKEVTNYFLFAEHQIYFFRFVVELTMLLLLSSIGWIGIWNHWLDNV